MEAGFEVSDYRYVGMGANRFYDFVLIHKYLGTTKMISLEHDPKMIRRAEFNKPYKFIEIVPTASNDFILGNEYTKNSIYWMDYDGRVRQSIVQDIAALGPKLVLGDFVFVTICAEPPRFLQSKSGADRLTEIKDRFGDFANALTLEDMENATFIDAVHKILHAAFKFTFATRKEGQFRTFFQIEYADGVKMLTYGGVFATKDMLSEYVKVLRTKIPFLRHRGLSRYKISKFDLTDKEKRLFDLAATSSTEDKIEIREMRRLGFRAAELKRYKELLRYHPRYVETFV